MRASHNRQTRRAALCIRARAPRRPEPAMSAADSRALAEAAARIAEELELSPEVLDDLLWGPTTSGGGAARA